METPKMPSSTPNTDAPRKDVFCFIPHTHWEGAVFKTRADYLDMGLPNILRALRLLRERPDYRFTLDQVCYVKPFLERYPHEAADFRRFVDEGRLAIVGGTDTMLDVNMPSGESFVRQVLYGKRWFREALGVDVTVGWQLDTFGHHAQMPQLLRLAGFGSFWFFRGVADWSVPSEFQWQGLDGSRIPAYWLPQGYAITYGSPSDFDAFTAFMKERFEMLAPQSRGRGRGGPAGADVVAPEEHVPALVEAFNRDADSPFELRLATPADFEALVAERGELPVVCGEMNPIFQGIYSSRIELKQATREIERLLGTAEKLGVLLRLQGVPVDDDILWRAWEPALFNQAHDLMSGVMTNYVYEDTLCTYDVSRKIGEEQMQERLRALTDLIDTRGDGSVLVVFNPLGWTRTDVVIADVGFSDSSAAGLRVVDPDGVSVPVQILSAERDGAGALVQARIAFVAEDVPALGHAVYRVLPGPDVTGAQDASGAHEATLENEHVRVCVDATTGAITAITLKSADWAALRAPGNVVARENDHGDLWEPYHPLDGGSRIAMTDRHPAPEPGAAVFSTDDAGTPVSVLRGPVLSEITVEHGFGESGRFATTVRVYAGIRRVEVRTRILNNDTFVRYRVLFPSTLEGGSTAREIPFGAIEQPEGIEFPAQNWFDHSDGAHGLAILNRGLPGCNTADDTLMLSLLRCTSILAYGFGGGYEPGMGSDSGQELGKRRAFDYALVPHAGDWRDAGITREGFAFNQPLLAANAASHPGDLPNRWGLLTIDCTQIVVSALKDGGDGTAVLRLYEATGQPAERVTVKFAADVEWAEEVNLIEDPGERLIVRDDALRLDFRAFEIKTVRVKVLPG